MYVKLGNENIGFEFKFLKTTSDTTVPRIKIVNDIKRLCWLKEKSKIDKGYFLLATNESPFINKGDKKDCFETYQGSSYTTGNNFPFTTKCDNSDNNKKENRVKQLENSSSEIIRVPKDILFNWNGIIKEKNKYKLNKSANIEMRLA